MEKSPTLTVEVPGDIEQPDEVLADYKEGKPYESPVLAISNYSHTDIREEWKEMSPSKMFAPTESNALAILTFDHIKVTTKTKPKKVLLDDISGSITGGFWAIMGASGGGKTTLLSTLSLRLDTNYMDISGEFRLNGREYSRQVLKAMSAYVMQDDLLHAELTVQETLYYSAQLRMPSHIPNTVKEHRIEELIHLLGIASCRNTIIGSSRRKGISGGERKRVSVAIELLNRPKLLFLDEPTSGLDSTTASSVARALKALSEKRECTVICTIHQPMPKIFRLFDNLILMKRGKIVYQGHAMKTVLFLELIGMPCPPGVDLADHLLDIISPTRSDVDTLDEHYKLQVPVELSLGMDKTLWTDASTHSWWHELLTLSNRNFLLYYRQKDIIIFNIIATVVIATFIGLGFWHDIGINQSSISKRTAALFFSMVNQGVVGSLQAITSFPSERAIMLRERAAGTYSSSAYMMAKTFVDLTTSFWPPILFSGIVYFAVGFQHSAVKFLWFTLFTLLDTYAAISLSTLVVCTCISIERSTVALSFLFEITRLYGGYYTSPRQLDRFPEWRFADALSYIKYAYIGVALNELEGLKYDCDTDESCIYRTGEQQIEAMGYGEYTKASCVAYLIMLIASFRFLGYLGLRFLKG